MKKKLFIVIFVLAVVAVAGYGVMKTDNSKLELSALALENVEALAYLEGETPSVDINWGQYYCVCKRGECRRGRWISFRSRCGGTPSLDPVNCSSFSC